MSEIVFMIENTGDNYKYDTRYTELDYTSTGYHIMTELDSLPTARHYISILLYLICYMEKQDSHGTLTIILNEKTDCYDVSVSLEIFSLPELLIFNKSDLDNINKLNDTQLNQLYKTANEKGMQKVQKNFGYI